MVRHSIPQGRLGLRGQRSGGCRPGTAGITLSLSPLDIERQQFHLGAVQTLQVRLECVLTHQLVESHYTEDGGLPDTALHIVVRLQGGRESDQHLSLSAQLTFNSPGMTSPT